MENEKLHVNTKIFLEKYVWLSRYSNKGKTDARPLVTYQGYE
jgi:hypothetical protein